MITINMKSKADMVEGQGVLSAHDEQVNLIRDELSEYFDVSENQHGAFDITHYHTINPGYLLEQPFVKTKGVSVGYVHFLPETLENSIKLPGPIRKIFYRYVIHFYKSMDYLVTVNPYFIERLVAYGVDRKKVSYIPNFVSDKQFFPIEDKAALRKKYQLEPDIFTVLCVGQLQKRKGVLEFIEIAKQMPEVRFLWAGSSVFGKISDGFDEINYAVENAPDNVTFLGLIDRSKMNELYNLADVMFLPSYEELFPMTILESMNCKIPILLRDLEIYEDILFDYYLRESDNQGFMQCINRLKQKDSFYQSACAKSYEGHLFYSREHVSAMWKTFYEAVALKVRDVSPAEMQKSVLPKTL